MMKKGLFRRSASSASSVSRASTADSFSDADTSRTSIDSSDLRETIVPIDLKTTAQTAPILDLPIELIQTIASFLDSASAASFCLSSRYICYSIGTDRLSQYIEASKTRFEKRRTIEAIVERAFPGNWFCAWCDKFHPWSSITGPTTFPLERRKDCAEFNSYLHFAKDYVLCYHHIRLALNHSFRGAEHGIPLSAFSYSKAGMAKVFRTPVPTKLETSARIVNGHFLLHTSFAVILPEWTTSKKDLLNQLWPHLPHVLVGHRDSENGHTGLMAAVDNVVRRNWQYLFTQMCASCTTDWTVACHHFPHATGGQARLVIQTWRDLGDGRNPFDTAWRAHGVCIKGLERAGADFIRVTGLQAGDIRRAFDAPREGESSGQMAERATSPARARIYRAFMRKGAGDDGHGEPRRSRASRPRTWRTASENEKVARREEEEEMEVERQAAEDLVRDDARHTAY